MFDTVKFGRYLSGLRKQADMTQSELAERLNLTRQAISKYETGDSFPDISILAHIGQIFQVSVEKLIHAGGPTPGEAAILGNIAIGSPLPSVKKAEDVVNLAPLLRPSTLEKLSASLARQGINISALVGLAQYLSDETVTVMLEKADCGQADEELLEKLMPVLDEESRSTVFEKILAGKMDWHMIRVLLPYARYMTSHIEAAVLEGALPAEVLGMMRGDDIS